MRSAFDRIMFRLMAEQFNEEKRYEFESLGSGGHYTDNQRGYAFELIDQNGIRERAIGPSQVCSAHLLCLYYPGSCGCPCMFECRQNLALHP